jgi:hypothetical protein
MAHRAWCLGGDLSAGQTLAVQLARLRDGFQALLLMQLAALDREPVARLQPTDAKVALASADYSRSDVGRHSTARISRSRQ